MKAVTVSIDYDALLDLLSFPKKAKVESIWYDYSLRALQLIVSHPDLPDVAKGCQPLITEFPINLSSEESKLLSKGST